ncbi:MAG: hypothetical protein GX075_07425 [Firmicutes bacterium]|nr:hypothetical protein [Bacillota bacterium]
MFDKKGGVNHLIDKSLTKFVDELNDGLNPNPENYIAECPQEYRQELKCLIETTIFLKKNLISQSFLEKELKSAHDLVSRLAKERAQNPTNKMVVNFRKGDITTEEEKIVKQEIDRLWKEKFGSDE